MRYRTGMRARSSLLLVSMVSSLALASVACGGNKGAPAKTPDGAAASGSDVSGGPDRASLADGSDTSSGNPGTGGTTTTTQLGSGGDLQGAKLGSSSRKEVETKGESGPKPNGPSKEPGRTVSDIQAIIGAHRDEARACYDKGLKDHPGIEGNLDVKWTIDPDGNVTNAEVDSSKSAILEPSVQACVVDVIKKLKFAKSEKGFETRAHYPFDFHPRNAPAKPATAK